MNHHDCRSCDSYRSGEQALRPYCELGMPSFPYSGRDCDLYQYEPGSDVDEDLDDE